MTTLTDKAILSGADNRPPMLEKDMYDSWKSRMELYMMNRQHGRMILESVENGPLIWPTIEENGVTRPRKYSELSSADAIQADSVVKSRYLTTNNQLRNSSNPRKQATINNGRVTLQPVQGRSLVNKCQILADSRIPEDDLAEVHNHDNVNNNMLNQAVQAMPSSE
ncbi:hypothetical protein Tco_0851933 [Tanacetum coccineum]